MKNTSAVCILFLLFSLPGFNQTINDIPIKDIDTQYVQIIGTSRVLSDKVNIQIDFGQNTKFFGSNKIKKILDKDGKIIKFNSMIDALNFMSANGYEFVQAFALEQENQNVYHYLLKKEDQVHKPQKYRK